MYVPGQGDIVYLDFSPQSGHEQKGRRPALVVSNEVFHRYTRAAVVCPITNTRRGFPLHIPLDERTKTSGVILCEQVKALDVLSRNIEYVEAAPDDLLRRALDIVTMFFEA